MLAFVYTSFSAVSRSARFLWNQLTALSEGYLSHTSIKVQLKLGHPFGNILHVSIFGLPGDCQDISFK
jgi:hypothetical protein